MTAARRQTAVIEIPRTPDPIDGLAAVLAAIDRNTAAIDRHTDTLAVLGQKVDTVIALHAPAPAREADPADRRLWGELVRVMASEIFTASELRAHAGIDPELAGAIQDADVDIADDARELGHWLRRTAAAGAIDGLALVRVDGYDRRGLLWQVRVVASCSTQNSIGAE